MINSRSIDDLRADVAANCRIWMARCKAEGLNVLITQTLRDDEYQAKLYAVGRTVKGGIITNSRVTTFHGVGLAFDFCKNVKGHEYDDSVFFARAAAIAKEMGFTWGGDWRSFPDRPHLQWDAHGKYTGTQVRRGVMPPAMPAWIDKREEVETVDVDKLIDQMTDKQAYKLLEKAQRHAATLPLPETWAADAALSEAVKAAITDGAAPMRLVTRLEAAIMAARAK